MPVLRCGVFFDGTGCNAYNFLSTARENDPRQAEETCDETTCQKTELFSIQVQKETHTPEAGYDLDSRSGSYKSPPTNIWYLYKHYETGKSHLGYQIAIYVPGVGTYTGEDDDTVTMGLGYTLQPSWRTLWIRAPWQPKHATGVIDKTDTAIELLGEELEKYKDELKDLTFDSIEYELFGFSRGATSARHLANRIAQKDKALVKVIKKKLGDKIYSSIDTEPVGSINMIGLFDSVAAILALSNASLDVSDAKTGAVKVDLTNVKAKHIFHLTAAHEMRYNFSLNRTLPSPNAVELELPGAHSDVGGGYLPNTDERLFISVPFYSEEKDKTELVDSQAHKDAEKAMAELLKHPRWGPIWSGPHCDVKIVGWSSKERFLHHAVHATKLCGAAVIMRRLGIQTGLEVVAMDAMREYCVQTGGSLFQTIANPSIPGDLYPLRDAARSKLQQLSAPTSGDNSSANKSQLESVLDQFDADLARKYIHCSAYYQAIDANLKVYEVVSPKLVPKMFAKKVTLTMRPTDDLVRHEYDSTGIQFKR